MESIRVRWARVHLHETSVKWFGYCDMTCYPAGWAIWTSVRCSKGMNVIIDNTQVDSAISMMLMRAKKISPIPLLHHQLPDPVLSVHWSKWLDVSMNVFKELNIFVWKEKKYIYTSQWKIFFKKARGLAMVRLFSLGLCPAGFILHRWPSFPPHTAEVWSTSLPRSTEPTQNSTLAAFQLPRSATLRLPRRSMM